MQSRTRKSGLLAALGAVLLALGGCVATPKADVLRFHQNQPIAAGTIDLRPLAAENASSLEYEVQAAAVARELRARGFTVAAAGGTQFTALVGLETVERAAMPRRSGLSIGLGGGFSSGNVGIGTGVSVPVGGKSSPQTAATTTLAVRIVGNPGGTPLWEGRASLDTEARGQRGTALASTLAQALFADFPGPSGQTVAVPIR